MSETRITDLVAPEAIAQLKALNEELKSVLSVYSGVAKELSKGINVSVKGIEDIDRIEKLLSEKGKECVDVTLKLTDVVNKQNTVIANTTNTISRQLMEQERVNKTQREAYTDTDKFKQLLEKVNGSYEHRVQRLVSVEKELQNAREEEKKLTQELAKGKVTQAQYTEIMTELRIQTRSLAQEKSDITTHLKNEEREMASVEGSYRNLSQRLELMKKAYKDLTTEERDSPLGLEMEGAIQSLDAHLKDLAADMGEFQRNVGNYAIAGQNGVVSMESLNAVLQQHAVTTKDVADQSKILTEAREMLDQNDANYTETVTLINDKLQENKRRLTDVSDIMDVQATSVAEAEAQNSRLVEALKQVDLTSENASEQTKALNDKIEENNKIIKDNSASNGSLKKDLRELVLEIANLSIEYANLSEEEQKSAKGQELKAHIDDLTERAGVLKDAISDTNAAITNAASDTRTFDQIGEGLQLAINGFGLCTGAAEMLGISEGELAEIQTKLQAAIAASNAMQAIQNSLQSQSALMQGVNIAQTKLRTVATNIQTAAEGKGIIVTKAATAAAWAFNAAAAANPIGLIVVAVVACVAALWGLVKVFQAITGPSDKAVKSYEAQKQALDEMTEAHKRNEDAMKARGATEAELTRQSMKNKEDELYATMHLVKNAEAAYGRDSDQYKEAVEKKKDAEEEFRKSRQDSLNYLMSIIAESEAEEKKQTLGTYEYKRWIIDQELADQKELAAALLANGEITQEIYDNIVASLDKAAKQRKENVNTEEKRSKSSGGSKVDKAKKEAEELKKAVRAGEDALLNIIVDSLKRQEAQEKLSYERRLKELEAKLKKTSDKELAMRKALKEQIEGLEAEHKQKMEQIQFSQIDRYQSAQERLIQSNLAYVKKGSEEEKQLRLQLLTIQRDKELAEIAKNEADKTLTMEEANELRASIVEKYGKYQSDLEQEYIDKDIEKIEERYAVEETLRNQAFNERLVKLKEQYNKEMQLAKGNPAKQAEIRKKYEREVAEATIAYSKKACAASIAMIEEVLANEKLSAEDRQKWERRLTDAKIKMAKEVADANEDANDQINSDDENLGNHRRERAAKWLDIAKEAISAVADLSSALYEGKIANIEAEQEANQEAGENEQARIDELVAKKVITEEEGEARKRAAESETAKKEEELAKKKAKLQRRQAIFQKANDIAQIGISTALAIMSAAATIPFLPLGLAMAAVAGTMGAIQLATAIATPIPQYAKGTDYHPGGLAIVGDGGKQEAVMHNGRVWLTPSTPTLVDMPQGASVVPDVDIASALMPASDMPAEMFVPSHTTFDDKGIRRDISELISLIKQQNKQQHRDACDKRYEQYIQSRI